MEYIPHIYQQAFHESKARYKLLCAGRRGGKTVGGALELLIGINQTPNGQGCVLSPTFPMLRDIAVPELIRWGAAYIENFNRGEMVMYFKNGYKLLLRSASDPDKLRGLKLHHLWMDEATSFNQLAWDTISPALVDFGGKVWVTTTPKGKDWVHQTFWVPAQELDPDYAAWKFKTVDNTYIDSTLVGKEEKKLEGKFFRQEYEASFEEFMGQIFPDFSTKNHVIEPFFIPSDWRIVKGMDIGYTHPFAAIWIAIDEEDRYFIFKEYCQSELTMKQNGENVMKLDKYKSVSFQIDPSAYAKDHVSGQEKVKDLKNMGMYLKPAYNNVYAGINRITDLIRNNQLFIFSDCQFLIEEMLNYRWDARSTLRNKPEPHKLGDDLLDALRYAVMHYKERKTKAVKPAKDLTQYDIEKIMWNTAMGGNDQKIENIEHW